MEPVLAKKFSLDYLISSNAPNTTNAPAPAPAQPDKVFQMLSQPILRKLQAAPNRTLRVFQLIDQLEEVYGEIQVEALTEIIKPLESTGHIRVLQRDSYGNHELQLT